MAGQALVTIKDKQWAVDIAVLPPELFQGLGGIPAIPAGIGMLFDMGYEQIIQITTVPMLFPLDIAFLSEDLTVTEVYRNVEPGYLVISQGLSRYFIEVNAGELQDINLDDQVVVALLPFEEIPLTSDPVSMMFTLASFLLFGTLLVSITMEVVEIPKKSPVLLPDTSLKKTEASYELETDRMGNIIITRTDEPGKDVFLQFESDKDLIYDLLKKDEKKELDSGWTVRIKRNEPRASILDELWENSARRQTPSVTSRKLTRDDVTVETWQERDRLGIWITEKRTDKVIARWWDDEAREMFTDGFFKPGVPQRSTEKPSRAFIESVLDYAEHIGILSSPGSPSAISKQTRKPVSGDNLDFLPDSPDFLAYTLDDIGYREKIDTAFLSAIARSRGRNS